MNKLLDAANAPHRMAFMLAAMTGACLGEVLGLRWRNIDLDVGTARIEAQLDRQGELAPVKTERSRRTIELPAALIASLRAHKLRATRSLPDDFVLTCERTLRPLDHRTVTRAFEAAI